MTGIDAERFRDPWAATPGTDRRRDPRRYRVQPHSPRGDDGNFARRDRLAVYTDPEGLTGN